MSCLLTVLSLLAQEPGQQRRITPVKPATNTTLPPPKGTDEETIKRFLLGDSLDYDEKQRQDSIKRAYLHYPKLTEWTLGLNFMEPVLMAFGQDYASFDVHATLNMWNRLQPVAELGLGWGKTTPDDLNFTYRAKLSPYLKLGVNYNFLFKSDPHYQAFLGVRLAYSPFRYDITDVTYKNSYWQEYNLFEIKSQTSQALWGEALAGLRVNVWKQWSLGWTIRYHGLFTYKSNEQSKPWFIPGYGPRKQAVSFTFSAAYTFPIGQKKTTKHDDESENN